MKLGTTKWLDAQKEDKDDDATGHGTQVVGLILENNYGIIKKKNYDFFAVHVYRAIWNNDSNDEFGVFRALETAVLTSDIINISIHIFHKDIKSLDIKKFYNIAVGAPTTIFVIAAGNGSHDLDTLPISDFAALDNVVIVGARDKNVIFELWKENRNVFGTGSGYYNSNIING